MSLESQAVSAGETKHFVTFLVKHVIINMFKAWPLPRYQAYRLAHHPALYYCSKGPRANTETTRGQIWSVWLICLVAWRLPCIYLFSNIYTYSAFPRLGATLFFFSSYVDSGPASTFHPNISGISSTPKNI